LQISRMKPVDLHKLWPHESTKFTPWLAENLDLLGEKLGMNLTLVKTEASAGTLSADILAEDDEGNRVIIENQLGRTDHDHLGKLIAYMANLEAKVAVWITGDPRPEHETAVHWLNEILPVDTAFYLMKLEAYCIGESPPAPLLTIVAGPSPEAKQIGEQQKEWAESHRLRFEFWKQLLERARKKTPLHANVSPSKDSFVSAGAGKTGFSWNYTILRKKAKVELYLDTGETEKNKRIFDQLFAQKEQIEEAFGEPLRWERRDDRQSCSIVKWLDCGGLQDQEEWPAIQDKMIDAMVRLEKALKPHLNALQV